MRLLDIFKKPARSGILGVEVGPWGTSLAWVDRSHGNSFGSCECHFLEGNDLPGNGQVLKQHLAESSLQNMPTHVVLHPAIYEIYFIDRPEVQDDELCDAVKWKIKDLVDAPLNDLVIDAFALPDDAYRGSQKKVYAVTVKKKLLQGIIRSLKSSGLDIQSIGISELAVGNIVNLLSDESKGAAMLRMRNATGTINLSESGNVYLTRRIESGISILEHDDETEKNRMLEEFLLEIQRSLDYYDTQLAKGSIRDFLIAPTRIDHQVIDDYLRDQLRLNVRPVDINSLFEIEEEMTNELQSNCFAAIGAACGEVGPGARLT